MVKNNKTSVINRNEGLGSFSCHLCGAVFSGPDRNKFGLMGRLHFKAVHKTTPKGQKINDPNLINPRNRQAGVNEIRYNMEMVYKIREQLKYKIE